MSDANGSLEKNWKPEYSTQPRCGLRQTRMIKKKLAPPADELASVMAVRFNEEGYLGQDEAVDLITKQGGECWLTENNNGNIAIHKAVLTEFRKLTDGKAVWMKSAFAWRQFDRNSDAPGTREQPL